MHLDENFTNADLGSCMDYSGRPQNNLLPSQADFDILNEIYGDGEDTKKKVTEKTQMEGHDE